jgi:hypothetical protein
MRFLIDSLQLGNMNLESLVIARYLERSTLDLVKQVEARIQTSFADLNKHFVSCFIEVQRYYKNLKTHLLSIRQGSREPLRSYIN